jgi:ATP-dependent DNA helicase RecG
MAKPKDAAAAAGTQPLSALRGVGPALEQSLMRLGLRSVQDLWFHLPLRWEDRTRVTPIAALLPGERAQVEGVVEAAERGFRFRPQLKVAISDDSRRTLLLRFFHFRAAQVAQLTPGTRLRCFGEARHGAHGLEMVHPQYTCIDPALEAPLAERLTPVYPSTEGLHQARLRGLIRQALARLPTEREMDLLPQRLRSGLELPRLTDALRLVHEPPPDVALEDLLQGRHPAQRRLALEELLAHRLSLELRRQRLRALRAPELPGSGLLAGKLIEALPFQLTAAQSRVLAEIGDDLGRGEPMLRLLQGDVGSGKTVVAAMAALQAIESGRQVALMAPTELLAEQHLETFRGWFAPLGIEPVWLAGKVKGKARQQAMTAVADGAPLAVGTHALMQEAVAFRDLGLVIVDEQHRFGVHQRLALRDKGQSGERVPHQLVMTATPIPRTLAMTAYADLDVSVIDARPPGRTPVTTVMVGQGRREEVISRIQSACAEGRQAYWVCTLVEDSEQLQAQAAESVHAELSAVLEGLSVGLIHGRMKPADKQTVMAAFATGRMQLLVATTVIEVGVDVPNASLMIIENPERLGLAQLHQLRGRVGRGARDSHCVLLYQAPLSAQARERLGILRQTDDGFRIAEKDLELRGPGELLGTRQAGQMAFRVADLARDADLLPKVQHAAQTLLARHPQRAEMLVRRWLGAAERFAGA